MENSFTCYLVLGVISCCLSGRNRANSDSYSQSHPNSDVYCYTYVRTYCHRRSHSYPDSHTLSNADCDLHSVADFDVSSYEHAGTL